MEQLKTAGRLQLDGDHRTYLTTILNQVLPLPAEVEATIAEQEDRSRTDFVLTMLNDLHSAEEVETYAAGFDAYKTFTEAKALNIEPENAEATVALLTETLASETPADLVPEQLLERERLFFFIEKTVDLARRHLAGSGYYLQEYLDYQLIPPPYNGAVDV